jgi:hypothetical protein
LINLPGQTGRFRRGNRLDQARIVIPDIADARADRPADHVVGGVGGQQRLELRLVRRFFPEPYRPRIGGFRITGTRLWISAHKAELIDLHMRRSSSPGTASATGSKPVIGTSSIRSDR